MKIIGGGSGGAIVDSEQTVFVGAVGSSGPINKIEIHYDGELEGNNVTVGENGVIEMFTAGGNQSTLFAYSDVNNYGLIKGAGRILTDQGETLHNFGTLAPDTTWPLDVKNNLVFESGSIFEVTILDAIDWSVLNIDGDLSFSSGSLDIILMGGTLPQFGDVFTVLTWTGLKTGQFDFIDDLIFSGGLSFQANYLANSLELQVVPEPSTWTLMGMGCLFIFWRVRRRS